MYVPSSFKLLELDKSKEKWAATIEVKFCCGKEMSVYSKIKKLSGHDYHFTELHLIYNCFCELGKMIELS